MHIRMRNAEGLTNSQINEFLKASTGISSRGKAAQEVYATSFRTVVRVSMTIRYLIAGPAGEESLDDMAGAPTSRVTARDPLR